MQCSVVIAARDEEARIEQTIHHLLAQRDGQGGWQYDQGSWHVYVLPYMEQGNLYQQISTLGIGTPKIDVITRAVTAKILPATLPYQRCPSDGWNANNNSTNYVACTGLLNNGSDECKVPYNPFQPYCNGTAFGGTWTNCNGTNGLSTTAETPRTKGKTIASASDELAASTAPAVATPAK